MSHNDISEFFPSILDHAKEVLSVSIGCEHVPQSAIQTMQLFLRHEGIQISPLEVVGKSTWHACIIDEFECYKSARTFASAQLAEDWAIEEALRTLELGLKSD